MKSPTRTALCSAAALALTLSASADWRADLRAQLATAAPITDVLQQREALFEGVIGAHDVLIAWSDGAVMVEIDGQPAPALASWHEPGDPAAIGFSAYAGLLGPSQDAGLLGAVYINGLGDLCMDLEVAQNAARFILPSDGAPVVGTQVCRCRKFPVETGGCTNTKCDNTESCPDSSSHFCEWAGSQLAEFEVAFDLVVIDLGP